MKNLLKNTLIEINNGEHLTRESSNGYRHCKVLVSLKESNVLEKQLQAQNIKGLTVNISNVSGIGREVMYEFIFDIENYTCPELNKNELAYENEKILKELEEMKMYGL